jgi:hypothetical protein
LGYFFPVATPREGGEGERVGKRGRERGEREREKWMCSSHKLINSEII